MITFKKKSDLKSALSNKESANKKEAIVKPTVPSSADGDVQKSKPHD